MKHTDKLDSLSKQLKVASDNTMAARSLLRESEALETALSKEYRAALGTWKISKLKGMLGCWIQTNMAIEGIPLQGERVEIAYVRSGRRYKGIWAKHPKIKGERGMFWVGVQHLALGEPDDVSPAMQRLTRVMTSVLNRTMKGE